VRQKSNGPRALTSVSNGDPIGKSRTGEHAHLLFLSHRTSVQNEKDTAYNSHCGYRGFLAPTEFVKRVLGVTKFLRIQSVDIQRQLTWTQSCPCSLSSFWCIDIAVPGSKFQSGWAPMQRTLAVYMRNLLRLLPFTFILHSSFNALTLLVWWHERQPGCRKSSFSSRQRFSCGLDAFSWPGDVE